MKSKKDFIYVAIIILFAGVAGQVYYSYQFKPEFDRKITVYYNQEHELNKEIIKLTQDADEFVYFAIYTFTRTDIQDALLAAKYRGLDVAGVVDKEQTAKVESQAKIVKTLREAGIPIYEQDHSAIMHLKTIVTEKAYASGSFNWTAAATNLNDEVLEVGRDEGVRKQYERVVRGLVEKYRENDKN